MLKVTECLMYSLVNSYYMDQPTNKLLITTKALLLGLEYFSTFLKTKGHLLSRTKCWLPSLVEMEYFVPHCHNMFPMSLLYFYHSY